MKKKLVIAIIATFVGTSLLWVVAIFAFGIYIFGEPPFRLSIDYPSQVEVGEVFDIELEVINAKSEPVTLGSVDIHSSLLDGFELVGTTPPYDSESNVFGFHTLWYDQRISGSEGITMDITLKATQSGRHHGQLEVCTTSEKCTTTYLSIDVGSDRAVV